MLRSLKDTRMGTRVEAIITIMVAGSHKGRSMAIGGMTDHCPHHPSKMLVRLMLGSMQLWKK